MDEIKVTGSECKKYSCTTRLLDDSETTLEVTKDLLGQVLLDHVCKALDLMEKDYFGLRYVDNTKQRHWLDTKKEISKQLKDIRQPFMFFFRVKFYPTDPTKVKEDITRYQIYLQLKRDILHGRLLCPFNNITDLAAHIVQAEVGDYNQEEHGTTYIDGIKLLPRHSEKLEEKIIEYHKTLAGLTPLEAESRFLNLAHVQDLYGVDPHPCKDEDEAPLYLGLTPQGIQIIREAKRVSGFPWRKVIKVSYDNKLFYVQVQTNTLDKRNYAFRLSDTAACKHLWMCVLEHMAFYGDETKRNKNKSSKRSALSPQLLFRKSRYKYRGKTENDVLNEANSISRAKPPDFERSSSLRLSVNLNCAKNSYSLPNLKEMSNPGSYRGTAESSNCSTDDEKSHEETSSDPMNSNSNNGDSVALAEFETKHFPEEVSSSRSSLLDDISIASSMDMGLTQSTIPEISVSDESLECNDHQSEVNNNHKCPPKPLSTRLVVAVYKEPLWLLILLAITAIPMAILLQMANVNMH